MTTGKISAIAILYNDNNVNGILESDRDLVLNNKSVTLFDGNGNQVASITTDANGFYSFDNLAAGSYTVRFPNGPSIFFSPKNVRDNESRL